MSIKVVTDSTCDLPASIVTAYDITVIPCYINLGGKSYLDGLELSRQEAPLSAEVTPAIGAHVGPGALGLVAMRKDV